MKRHNLAHQAKNDISYISHTVGLCIYPTPMISYEDSSQTYAAFMPTLKRSNFMDLQKVHLQAEYGLLQCIR